MIDNLRAIGIIIAVLTITALILPIHLLAMWRKWPLRKTTARLWHRRVAAVMGLRITTHGPEPAPGTLLAANHVSWLDIVALGASANVNFIAKDEVRQMPGFGQLARLQESQFVARNARVQSAEQATTTARRLASGDIMVLFAEATTSDGNFLLPFKSSLFGALGRLDGGHQTANAWVQPVAIAYTAIDGLPMGRRLRPIAAWPGDLEIGPHLWRVLREGRIDVAIAFGVPIKVTGGTDRKTLAARCQAQVRTMFAALVAGEVPSTGGQKPLSSGP